MIEAGEEFLRELEQEASEEVALAVSCVLAAEAQPGEEAELTLLQARFHNAKAQWLREFVARCRQMEASA